MDVDVGWATATGARPENQDCVLVNGMLSVGDTASAAVLEVDADRPLLVAVFDGLGGHAGGGMASRIAAGVLGAGQTPRNEGDLVADARRAHRTVASFAQALPGTAGMATTMVGFLINGSVYHVFHVGDSLAYRLVDGSVGCLTEPHRAPDLRHPDAMVLTRCLGVGADEAPDIDTFPIRRPVRLLACSDGVSEVLSPDELRMHLAAGIPVEAARGLVSAAEAAGSRDNMTALVVELSPSG